METVEEECGVVDRVIRISKKVCRTQNKAISPPLPSPPLPSPPLPSPPLPSPPLPSPPLPSPPLPSPPLPSPPLPSLPSPPLPSPPLPSPPLPSPPLPPLLPTTNGTYWYLLPISICLEGSTRRGRYKSLVAKITLKQIRWCLMLGTSTHTRTVTLDGILTLTWMPWIEFLSGRTCILLWILYGNMVDFSFIVTLYVSDLRNVTSTVLVHWRDDLSCPVPPPSLVHTPTSGGKKAKFKTEIEAKRQAKLLVEKKATQDYCNMLL